MKCYFFSQEQKRRSMQNYLLISSILYLELIAGGIFAKRLLIVSLFQHAYDCRVNFESVL